MLYNLLECVRLSAVLLTPFMPETCGKIFAPLGVDEGAHTWESAGAWGLPPAGAAVSKGENLFPRIDVEKELAALDELYAAFPAERAAWLERYRADCLTLGRTVRLLRAGGEEEAFAEAVDDTFALVVRRADGSREAVSSGEVSVRGMYGYV